MAAMLTRHVVDAITGDAAFNAVPVRVEAA
jgi:hypothetical protein